MIMCYSVMWEYYSIMYDTREYYPRTYHTREYYSSRYCAREYYTREYYTNEYFTSMYYMREYYASMYNTREYQHYIQKYLNEDFIKIFLLLLITATSSSPFAHFFPIEMKIHTQSNSLTRRRQLEAFSIMQSNEWDFFPNLLNG